MEEQRYWFEGVPEEERFWFLASWPAFSSGQAFEVTFKDEQGEGVFGPDEAEEAEIDRLVERMEEVGFAPTALCIPWWPEVMPKHMHEKGREYVEAPVLFTTRERAEAELRRIEDREPDDYLSLQERYGETLTNAAVDSADPLRLLWVTRNLLLDKLEDSDFLCVKVDDRLKLRQDFIEELRKQTE